MWKEGQDLFPGKMSYGKKDVIWEKPHQSLLAVCREKGRAVVYVVYSFFQFNCLDTLH